MRHTPQLEDWRRYHGWREKRATLFGLLDLLLNLSFSLLFFFATSRNNQSLRRQCVDEKENISDNHNIAKCNQRADRCRLSPSIPYTRRSKKLYINRCLWYVRDVIDRARDESRKIN